MIDPYWFQKKWGTKTKEEIPMDDVYDRLSDLEVLVKDLELRIEELQRENVETTNELYRVENSLDSRIDILAERFWSEQDV
jgi:predicted RNase H-like nuclease (RuvC/YqgF family)